MKTTSMPQASFDHHVDRVLRAFEILERESPRTDKSDQIEIAIALVKEVEETCKENFALSHQDFIYKCVTVGAVAPEKSDEC